MTTREVAEEETMVEMVERESEVMVVRVVAGMELVVTTTTVEGD